MTWNNPPKLTPTKPKPGKKITPEQLAASGSEDGEQAALFCWAADNVETYPPLKYLFAIPNGGSRHIAEATKMVATGLRKGVPDLMLPVNLARYFEDGNLYAGCFIEMKVGNNKPSKEQEDWLEYLRNAGYFWAICYSWQDARDILREYMEGKL